jgi:hypothetical protein
MRVENLSCLVVVTAAMLSWASCTCPSPNVRASGTFTVNEPGNPALHPLEALGGVLGGDDQLTSCFRSQACARLVLHVTNLFDSQIDCAARDANPACFDFTLTFFPGRLATNERRRMCADDAHPAAAIEYRQFPLKAPNQSERLSKWTGGCIQIDWVGESAHIQFDGATIELDSGRNLDLSGEIRLTDPEDQVSC